MANLRPVRTVFRNPITKEPTEAFVVDKVSGASYTVPEQELPNIDIDSQTFWEKAEVDAGFFIDPTDQIEEIEATR